MRSAIFFVSLSITAALASFMLSGSNPVWASGVCADDLPNFHAVGARISRSGQPSYAGLSSLANQGYKTIVDLRMEADQVAQESQWVSKLGMKFVPIPMDQLHEPGQTAVQTFIATLKDPQNQPVLVHGAQGDDRTGAMVAFYRMQEQHWPAEKAYKEMLRYGFHPMFTALSDSVFDYQDEKNMIAGRPVDAHPHNQPDMKGGAKFDQRNLSRLGSRLGLVPM